MIVFCHLLNDNSGSPVVLRMAIQAFARDDGERVLFVGRQGRGCLETADVPIRRYWYNRSRFRLVTLFTYAASQICLYRSLSQAKLPADVVIYVNTLLPFGAALWGCRHNRTVIYHVHEVSISPDLLRRFLVRMVEKTARQVFYVSEDHRKRLPIRGVPSTVIPNPIAPQIADRGFATAYAPRCSGRFEVLMLASPRDFKGVPEFLDLAHHFRLRADVCFTLVLNGDAEEIATYLPNGSVPENVCVHPRTNAPENYYATADLLLNLSRVDLWIETFGLTVAEGMAFGLPVIVPPVGGPSELVSEGVEGYLIDSRDHKALASAVSKLADDSALCMALSKAARRKAGTLSWTAFAERLISEVQAVQNDKAGS